MDNKNIDGISDLVYRVSIQVKLDNHIEYSSIAFYKTEEGRLYILRMFKTPNLHMNRTYINMYSRLLLVSGLDYHIKDHTYFVYMKNIKDFDRHVDILLTIERTYFSDIACTYDRDKVKRFFNGL